jgi:hypothetical protein
MTGRVQQLREVPGPPPAPIPLRPPRRRRSKLLILVGIVLSAVSATGTVWLFNATDDAVPAVGVARPVRYGETITADSLREVRVRPDPGVQPLTWKQRSDLVGRTSPTDLLPGGIVTSEVLSATADIPAPDQQLVGVPVKAGQLPVTALEPRQPVLLVPAGAAPDSWGPVHGSVVTVGPRGFVHRPSGGRRRTCRLRPTTGDPGSNPGDVWHAGPDVIQRCIVAGCPPEGVVADPFGSSASVDAVARRLGRRYVGSRARRLAA